MSEGIVVALIAGIFGLVQLAYTNRVSRKVDRTAVDVRASRTQLENGHSTNLREEGDERHAENGHKLDRILHDVDRIRDSVGKLWERLDRHTDQIHDLEMTQPRRRPK